MTTFLAGVLLIISLCAIAFTFLWSDDARSKKRVAAIRGEGGSAGALDPERRQRNALEDVREAKAQAKRADLQKRIERAGLTITVRNYWVASGISGVVAAFVSLLFVHSIIAFVLAGFAGGLGLPRWVLTFLTTRREQAFTREFAPAMDAIVRSVKSGLPVIEALKLVATEIPQPVGGEFQLLTDSLKVGLTMEQSIRRMYQRMPTPEVNFFGIVMSMQSKSGGNLSEALGNLAGVLRDRKRLKDKIRAMSSEARTGAVIIGSMPPGVMLLVYVTTPSYMAPMFSTEIGNALLVGCVVWMGIGTLVMKKMIAMKF
ncbi:MAG: type II secretion system F family protein [Alphaproteobacteria bacterium]|nr:type II secretion system F family protein [Alphaproteobacteria bacterium]